MSENGHKELSFEDIMACKDISEEVLTISQWGGTVKVRALTRAEVHAARTAATLKHDTPTGKRGELDMDVLERQLILRGCVAPRFSPDQVLALRDKHAGAIATIVNAISRLSGISDGAVQQAEATFQDEP